MTGTVYTMVKVSVVIPCYNQGQYIIETIDSVLAQTYAELEIIVVNDGSTDSYTNSLLASLKKDKTVVITTENQGLAAARNNGIDQASGDYILPLDADDLITPEYIERGVAVLEAEPDVGIVYCKARLFGAIEAEWNLPDYSIEEMVKDNVIFCTALFRREDWQTVGGYDSGMVHGWEDYDFWLSLIERGRKVRRLDGHYFLYRVASDSMVRSKEKWQKVSMFKRIYRKHTALFSENIGIWINELVDIKGKYNLSRLYIDCGNGFSQKESVVLKVEPGSTKLVFDIASFSDRIAVRFDPVDCPVCLKIHSIKLMGKTSCRECDSTEITTNALCRSDSKMFFDTDDPQVFIMVGEKEISIAEQVIIELDMFSLGDKALHEIISYQQDNVRAKSLIKYVPAWLSGSKQRQMK